MGFALRFLVLWNKAINFFVNLYLSVSQRGEKRKCVPPPTDELLMISATKLAELIRKKKVSCEDVVRAYINRIKEVNPLINAVVEDRFDEALKEAKSVTDYLRTTSLTEDELHKIKPLLGVPVTIKESCMVSGMSLAVGVVSRRDIKAESDGDAVARLKMTGAIPLLVSNTPELSMGFYCNNNITGTTCNPYDLSRNTGASSGGEGALLGSGASLIGIGSDLAGSVRFPAFCCGIFGHKPSPRAVSIRGHFPLPNDKKAYDYTSIGPLTRYAEDLKLVMTVLCGKQSVDLRLHEKVDLKKLRVYYMKEAPRSINNPPVQNEIKEAIDGSVKFLETSSKAKIIHECCFEEDFRDLFEISSTLMTNLNLEGCPDLFKGQNHGYYLEFLRALFGMSEITSQYAICKFQMGLSNIISNKKHFAMNEEIKRKIALELGDDGVLLYPTFHKVAPKHAAVMSEVVANVYMMPFNTLGLPATNIPCGLTPEGIPLGLQVIAGPNQDRLCLAVAEELEKCFGGWTPPRV
ncbi:fatty-acid amide hydrolase 2-like [Coccinella septempunctata]|uniref:fatty-acid amide hydrolase 2-like n=1 Tax=Coccinella septempunctata TaxID=41139 RepID=UPI001D05E93F|nr:fatty-acid amide hydrolase 2-like [Coccinella septempunctata]XP_044757456.1 fatty-acid amide hydrolase 2-like [Coccinella septempunctata]